MNRPQKFRLHVREEELQRVQQQLSLTNWPDEVPLNDPVSRGAPLSEVQSLARYWMSSFDWRKQEDMINELPQYLIDIEIEAFGTYNIHFVHQPSTTRKAVPFLFVHGWPGSFLEIKKILPGLIEGSEKAPAFHVVAPSLVDYGFSEGNKKEGFGIDQQAEMCHKLMLSLGYNEYVVQGGDIGYFVSRMLALKYPEACKAHHTNMPVPQAPTDKLDAEILAKVQKVPIDERDKRGLENTEQFAKSGMAYALLHMTRPQTIGYSLTDSPVGLLAWIYEKLVAWVDDYTWTPDEILTWVCIYRFSRAGPAAPQRLYLEMAHRQPKPTLGQAAEYIRVPLGTSHFPKDVYQLPKAWDHTLGPVAFQRDHGKGGHFAAWEQPEVLLQDIRDMFSRRSPVFGCVSGHEGFETP